MTPTWKTPPTPPEGSLSLTWDFETRETAQRWSDLMRDMIPMAVHTWWNRPQWEPRWSVELHSSLKRGHAVRVNLWCQPCDTRLDRE